MADRVRGDTEPAGDGRESRSVAQLRFLHSLAPRLNALDDVTAIGNAITAELQTLIDYHNCRIYLLQPDGKTLFPIVFRGSLGEYESETYEELVTEVGEGFTGRAAETGETYYAADALRDDVGVQIEGTSEIDESILCVPMKVGDRVTGVIVLSNLGIDQFEEDDIRLLEVLSSHAAVAFEGAQRVTELERFHELVESIDAVFWEADPETLAFTFLSRRAADVLGSSDDGAGGPHGWGDHVHPDDRDAAVVALRGALAKPGDDVSLEYRALSDHPEPPWVRDIVHVGTDARGDRTLRGLIVDVTERKLAEEALRRSEQTYSEAFRREREATQRLRALDDMKNTFLEAVSHDLRTPLTSILGSALTLEQSGLEISREDALDLVRRIAANARKLERLLSDLLDLDRLQRGIVSPQRRPTDVGALVAQAVEGSELLDDRQIELSTVGVVVNVDGAKVERIVDNLLANAARHTPPGTPLWIRVTGERGGVLIAVDDAGPGVADDLKLAVFEPFRQGDGGPNPSPGVGVGLSLVARFAELHGGSAWVQDRPGGGASFRVFLPDAR